MESEWTKLRIEDFADVKSGKRLPKGHTLTNIETSYPYIRLVDVADGRIRKENLQYLDISTRETIKRYIVNDTDVCLAIVGHTIGMVFYVDSQWDDVNLTENAARITNIKNDVSSKYLYYFLTSPKGQYEILSRKVGSAQGKLPLYNIKSLEIPLPPLPEQKRIAHILGSLDDKIELNRKMNETLEKMAQALFKSWFIDFDPVIDNALIAGNPIPEQFTKRTETRKKIHEENKNSLPDDIRNLFPGEFELTDELGWIPKGWEVKALDTIADYQNGLALQKFRPQEGEDFLPVLKIAQLRQGFTNGQEKASVNIKEECRVYDGDIIFSWSGSLLVDIWCGGKAALNQHLFKVTSQNYPKWFYYYYTKHHLEEFQRIAAYKAVTMGHIKREHLKQAFCTSPPQLALKSLGEIFEPLMNKMITQRLEAVSVVKLRDTLLPQLLSGELNFSCVNWTEKESEERGIC